MKKTIIFEIETKNEINLDFKNSTSRKYPVHSHNAYKIEKHRIEYEYCPDQSLNEKKYIDFLKQYVSEKFNAIILKVTTKD